ncbi:MAG: outer membrane beta-barrel protein, partial [Pacificimonas sp.]
DRDSVRTGAADQTGLRLSEGETDRVNNDTDPFDMLRGQDRRGQSVRRRSRPEYEARGAELGGFNVYPYAEIRAEYDSNVLAQQDGQGDMAGDLGAGVALRSDWQRHGLIFAASVNQREYADLTSESGTEYDARLDGTLDVTRDVVIAASALHEHRLVDRGAVGETLDTRAPVRLNRTAVSAATQTTRGRVFAKLTGRYEKFDYEDAVTPTGVVSNQQFRDADRFEVKGEAGTRVGAGGYAFVAASFAPRRARLDSTPRRDVDETQFLVGWRSEISPLVVGHIALGYLQGNFKDPSQDTRRAFAFSADVDYFATPLTTLSFSAERSLSGISSVTSPSALVSSFGVRADHELLRNVIISATGNLETANYVASPAKATRTGAAFSAEWLINPSFTLNARMGVSGRAAENFDADRDFSRFESSVSLKLTL